MKYSPTFFAVALLCPLLLGGCSKLTAENYSKLQAGMSFDETKKLIGSPTSCDDIMTVKRCSWSEGKRSATVAFVSNQIIWFNAENLR